MDSHVPRQSLRAHLDGTTVGAYHAIHHGDCFVEPALMCCHTETECSHREVAKPLAGSSTGADQATEVPSVLVVIVVPVESQAIQDS